MEWYDLEVELKRVNKQIKNLETRLYQAKQHKEWVEKEYDKKMTVAEAVHMEDLHKADELGRTMRNPNPLDLRDNQ